MRRAACLALLLALTLATYLLLRTGVYGLTLFVFLPVLLGAVAAWLETPTTERDACAQGAVVSLISMVALLAFGLEGAICIAMAAPIAIPLGITGSWLVFRAMRSDATPRLIAALILLQPAGFVWDTHAKPPLFEVTTEIEIAAPIEAVWPRVIAFPQLAEPEEWYFNSGLAYPIRARIEGTGPGAIRYCEFSTGPFVEPIQIWNAPDPARPTALLRFSVTESPAPMKEWSPWPDLEPRHLRGYMVSKQGQFLLTRHGNHTLLTGTTRYQHGLWPAQYWRWWSDAIIHRIHLRVLNHIKTLAEAGT